MLLNITRKVHKACLMVAPSLSLPFSEEGDTVLQGTA